MASETRFCARCLRCQEDGLGDNEVCSYYGEPCGCNHPNGGFPEVNETAVDLMRHLSDRSLELRLTAFDRATEDSLRATLHNFLLEAASYAERIEAAYHLETESASGRPMRNCDAVSDFHDAKRKFKDANANGPANYCRRLCYWLLSPVGQDSNGKGARNG